MDQYRNVHTLLRDFNDELDLYNQTGHLIQLLNDWKPPPGADLPRMMVGLGQAMADAKMWAQVRGSFLCSHTAQPSRDGCRHPKACLAMAAAERLGVCAGRACARQQLQHLSCQCTVRVGASVGVLIS